MINGAASMFEEPDMACGEYHDAGVRRSLTLAAPFDVGGSALPRHVINFFERRDAVGDELPSALCEGVEVTLLDDLLHGLDGGVAEDDVAEVVGEVQELEDGAPAAVTGAEAAAAAGGDHHLGLVAQELAQ